MWETIKDVLTSGNAWFILIFLVAVIVIGLILGRCGLIKVNTKHVQIGNELTQRELVRRQVETAYTFVMSLEGKIITEGSAYDRYLTKYILERVYDKVIEWIIFNHITTNQLYVQDKQDNIENLVYTMVVDDDFKTPEFKRRMDNWVKELIEQLVQVKEIYQ